MIATNTFALLFMSRFCSTVVPIFIGLARQIHSWCGFNSQKLRDPNQSFDPDFITTRQQSDEISKNLENLSSFF